MAPQVVSDDKESELRKLGGLLGLPTGLMLLDDIKEHEHDEDTGFVRMKWKHEFKAIGRLVQYETEISGYDKQHNMNNKNKGKMEVSGLKTNTLREWITITEISIDDPASAKKVSRAKSKELPGWITISEISVDGPSSAKICFKSGQSAATESAQSAATQSGAAGVKRE